MRILFTGASSFTGYWFVRELAAAGHEVVATLRQEPQAYEGVRAERVARLEGLCRRVHGVAFGDERFLRLIREEPSWDLLCHHAAEATNYKSPDFDIAEALRRNTWNLPAVLDALRQRGCRRVLLTGSIFEGGEGAGSEDLRAFSPYGVSKQVTADAFRYFCQVADLRLGKFVIPNPFGPLEEPRFTAYLVRCWREGKVAAVNTPAYVRDNIHVSLLAKVYAGFAAKLPCEAGFQKINPSGYIESQATFAQRFAAQMGPRLGVEARLELKHQTEFVEPRVRMNTDPAAPLAPEWSEEQAWDELANYYQQTAVPR